MNIRIKHLLQVVGAVAIVGSAVALCAPSARAAHFWGGRLFAQLHGSAINGVVPQGESEFVTNVAANGTVTHFMEVEVARVTLGSGAPLTVKLNGVLTGSLVLKGAYGIMQVYTARGARLPAAKKGDAITVSTVHGGIILSGKY